VPARRRAFAAIAAAVSAAVDGAFGGQAGAGLGADVVDGGAAAAGVGPESCGAGVGSAKFPPSARPGSSRQSTISKCGRVCIPYFADFHRDLLSWAIGSTFPPLSICVTTHDSSSA